MPRLQTDPPGLSGAAEADTVSLDQADSKVRRSLWSSFWFSAG